MYHGCFEAMNYNAELYLFMQTLAKPFIKLLEKSWCLRCVDVPIISSYNVLTEGNYSFLAVAIYLLEMAAARESVIEALKSNIECGICLVVKELRQLPCQHMLCLQCLGKF